MKVSVPKKLKEFCDAAPAPVYMVGGYVRNCLMGLKPSDDIDIAGALPIEEIAGAYKWQQINKRLGTALILLDGLKVEYTQFRQENYGAGGGHSPLSVTFTDDLRQDALRRDFTVNSVYYDIKNEQIVDALGGVEDIKNKILRCAEPEKIFASDGLRLLRLCRFAAELGCEIDLDTFKAAAANAVNLEDIAAERKRDELDKILNSDQKYGVKDAHYRGLRLMHELGLFKYVLPSLESMEIAQNPKYHKYNVLEHTFLAVKFAPPAVRLAALMHDTGKPVSQEKDGNMYNHAAESAAIVRRELGQSGLKYPLDTVTETERLVRLHMYDGNRQTGEGKMRIFVAQNMDIIDKLQMLAEADKLATGRELQPSEQPRFSQFKAKLLNEGAPLSLKDLAVDGLDAVNAGLKGKQIAAALDGLFAECVLNPKLNTRERLLNRLTKL